MTLPLPRRLLRLALKPFIAVLALVLVFEEWLWDALKAQAHKLGQLPGVRRFEDLLRRLPPWASLLVMVLPGLVLLPFKLAGLWAVGHHHPIVGVAIFIAAKVTGTALAAYLFDLVRAQARQLAWFDAVYIRIIAVLHAAKAWLHRQVIYRAVRAGLHRLRVGGQRFYALYLRPAHGRARLPVWKRWLRRMWRAR